MSAEQLQHSELSTESDRLQAERDKYKRALGLIRAILRELREEEKVLYATPEHLNLCRHVALYGIYCALYDLGDEKENQ